MHRNLQFLAAAALAALFTTNALAQYPDRPIRLIVPFPPGGAAELGARIFTAPLAQALGQPIVIETKPGADGAIAADAVMKAAPDGYTLFYATNTAFNWVLATRKNPPYNPVTDFTPVSFVGYFGFFLFSHPSVPANSVAELIAYARANPGKLNYGSGNSTAQLFGAQLAQLEKLDMVHVPYKGDGPLVIDLIGGRVHLAFSTPGTAAPQVKEGKLRALAAMFPSRSSLLPEVPTAAEAGLAKMSLTPWGGVFGPKGMPKEAVDRLARELAVVLKRPDVRESFGKLAFEPKSSTPEELTAILKQQIEVWGSIAREVGIKPE
ncbi:MAG TPA: tripartite tricarboxylate transporter substrate binding protein [Burkholderiales bacterium]|nr:tripartite tricarboxylate transporter substrate binding protein [Burkholderiales bacterium]